MTAKTDNPLLDGRIKAYQARVEQTLDRWLPAPGTHPARLHEAMRYAVLGGGKRIRPVLTYATGEALGVPLATLDGPAGAVELIHAYSLVHDDLPAMDNDDTRRGKPSCHKAFDEATAILVGDALQALAFYILAHDPDVGVDALTRVRMIEALALASSSRGLVGGQAIDLDSLGKSLDSAQLEDMYIHKTGALIRVSVMLGALSQPQIDAALWERLDHYAKCIGLAFQIRDDLLDVESDAAAACASPGTAPAAKPTYPSLFGLERTQQRADELLSDALDSLTPLGTRADTLGWLTRYIVERAY